MFSPTGLDFLIENRFNNSKEWFHEHKHIYDEYVLKPLTELAIEMTPTIEKLDPTIVTIPKINKVLSRIYRDTRFSKDKSLFRESVWLSYKKDKKEFRHYPEFFVVITPQALIYGCGYYYMTPEAVKAMRELIEENHPIWQKALKSYENQNIFTLEGEMYKRTKYPEYPENIRNWLDRKNVCCTAYSTDFDLVFSDKLGEKLCKDIVLMKDVYDFLILAENKARGIIKYD